MGEVCVAIKDAGVLRTTHVHKIMLNAFQAMLWFAPELNPSHSLLRVFDGPQPPLAPHEYGLVVIDRDARWVGSAQRFMRMSEINLFASEEMIQSVRSLDLAAELKRFDAALWPQLFAHEAVRALLLSQAYEAGAVRRVRVASWNDERAPWQKLKSLGLDTLPIAVEWLEKRRAELAGGKLMGATAAFEFSPPGWTVEDFGGGEDGFRALDVAMRERGVVEG